MANSDQVWSEISYNAPFGWSPQVECLLDPSYGTLIVCWVPNGPIFSEDGLLGASKRAPMVDIWVSDAYPVKIGQLGQFVDI